MLSGAFTEEGSGGVHLETSDVQSNIFKHVRARHDLGPASASESAVEAIRRAKIEEHERQHLKTKSWIHAQPLRRFQGSEHFAKIDLGK